MHPNQIGFAVHRRRGVVERFFAWIGRNPRLAKGLKPASPPPMPSCTLLP
jgi:hypothetical protein